MSDVSPERSSSQVPDDEDRELVEHRLDEEERESFPASDPHSDWAGPAEAV